MQLTVVDEKGNTREGIAVKNRAAKLYGYTDRQGILSVELANGPHTFMFYEEGILVLDTTITIHCDSLQQFRFVINGKWNRAAQLEEVSVYSRTAKQLMDISPFSVQAIDLQKEYNKGGDVSEVLNRASGIILRTDGNIGAPVQVNLGGLQGKAVRIFKDGIPVELFGHGFSLGTIPLNMLERVEIYKGVMPLYLASDALGGGINLVSRQESKKTLELSYEVASFNTHRITGNGLWHSKDRKWYIGANSSFNYSDNDYKVNVPVYAEGTGVRIFKDLPRFHDAVRTYYAEAFAGIRNRKWVDDLRFTLVASSFYKEIQHDGIMDKVYGGPHSKEQNITGLLNYRKSFLKNRLKVNVLAVYSLFNTKFTDTSTVRYGWDGQLLGTGLRPGEINLGNLQQIDYKFFSSRLNLSYRLSPDHVLDLSGLYYQQDRKGSDPLGAITAVEKIDVLTVPAVYRKSNIGLGLRSEWFNKRVESIIALKHYYFYTKGYTTDNFGLGWQSSVSNNQPGYLAGLRWNNEQFMAKLSYEYANRLPDENEIFGDGLMTKENMSLKPEKSHNVNLNGQYTLESEKHTLTLSAGLFYRKVKDIIFLQLDIPFNRYINYERSEIKGFEVEANYTPYKLFDLGFNVTYQDIRRVDIEESMFRFLEGSRIPNVPYLFGNTWLRKEFNSLLSKNDRVELNWNAHYTHRFFLYAIPKQAEPTLFGPIEKVQTSMLIPNDSRVGQFSHNVGLYYHFPNKRLSLSAECRNLSNVKLYDNFNIQKPGRSFHLKFVFQFLNQNIK
ncbi:MAG: TonB-dependent receptor plug domain-containing protein [Candidatus Pseudobacter hemicellulosilyticus]|uniref:TonB-dependent receptor plug domain-containing protein n=1 Tax=Candidatus Pseudobacter hemicellulosilyticus TaxID=3121375 RepID=A0AAJ5WS99_9BACT|nr:MAG: TonB-dependent receptor plug domain-containing protein [Pseudobacter sp.]